MPWMTGHAAAPDRLRLPTCLPTAAARRRLTGFSGILQVDGYAAYKALARGHGGAILLAFCLAHARRKFCRGVRDDEVAIRSRSDRAPAVVYAIEAEIRGSSAEQRLAVRRTRTAPPMEALRARRCRPSRQRSCAASAPPQSWRR
jgi:hypothetical protein